eukprot:1177585-Prorocentrum_minimum.AAC.1
MSAAFSNTSRISSAMMSFSAGRELQAKTTSAPFLTSSRASGSTPSTASAPLRPHPHPDSLRA